jgi:hypothetical protein
MCSAEALCLPVELIDTADRRFQAQTPHAVNIPALLRVVPRPVNTPCPVEKETIPVATLPIPRMKSRPAYE